MAKELKVVSEVFINMSDEEKNYVRDVIKAWRQLLLSEVSLVQECYYNALKASGMNEEQIKSIEQQTISEYLKLTGF